MIAEVKYTASGPELFICGVRVISGVPAEMEQIARLVNQGFAKSCQRAQQPHGLQGLWLSAEPR